MPRPVRLAGISIAGGMALSHVSWPGGQIGSFCIVGDGELNEGQCWEAFQFIAHHLVFNNLTVFVDWNKQQLDGELDEIICAFDLEGKFAPFGFDVVTVKGDDIPALNCEGHCTGSASGCASAGGDPRASRDREVAYLEQLGNSHHLRLTPESKALDEAIRQLEVTR